jgi:tetratricopeptide (TPR) repeat protein
MGNQPELVAEFVAQVDATIVKLRQAQEHLDDRGSNQLAIMTAQDCLEDYEQLRQQLDQVRPSALEKLAPGYGEERLEFIAATAYWVIGSAHFLEDRWQLAIDNYQECLARLGPEATDPQAVANENIGISYAELEQYDKAEPYFSRARELFTELGDTESVEFVEEWLAEVEVRKEVTSS